MLNDKRYKKPPLIEVFCDFYFELDEDESWDPKMLAQFSERMNQLGYPDDEDIPGQGPSGPRGAKARGRRRRNVSWGWRHRFTSEDKNRTTQIGENLLVINQFPPYYGWHNFKAEAIHCYELYQELWPSTKVVHAGLHYVDVVNIPEEQFYIDDYFRIFPVIPDELAAPSVNNIAMAYEIDGGNPGDLCAIAFHQRLSADPNVNTFRFRWDYISLDGFSNEIRAVEEWLDTAHDFVDRAFRSAFTEKCEELFEPEDH